jgi:hypothetical protein
VKRLRIALKRVEAMVVNRISIGHLKLAYVICADRRIKYRKGRSRIAYIGTTEVGIRRVARSAAVRSETVLGLRGVSRFDVRIVTCTPRQNVRSWRALERALILAFRDKYGEAPKANVHGQHGNYVWQNEKALFAIKRLNTIVDELS